MKTQSPPRRQLPLILSATQFELRAIRSAVERSGIAADFECIGVGPGAVWRWSSSRGSAESVRSPAGRCVILAGIAGALDHTLSFGSVRSASKIIGAGSDFVRPSPSFVPVLQSAQTTIIASVDAIITTPKRKLAIGMETGASLVDMESAAFASIASQREWNWGVLRAVSDDASAEVPEWICSILLNTGSIDMGALLLAIAANPRRAITLVSIGRALRHPLKDLGVAVVAMIRNASRKPRTLVFGGTFDPPHRRHAEVVAAAASELECERVIIVPAGQSPLRDGLTSASTEDRLTMVRRAFAKVRGVEIDTRELHRAGTSFTVDTLKEIAGECQMAREDLILLIGADQAMQFERWKEWREIDLRLATIAVIPRPPHGAAALATQLADKFAALGEDGQRWGASVLPFEAIDLSASHIRDRLRNGLDISDLVDPSVEAWIREHSLYR